MFQFLSLRKRKLDTLLVYNILRHLSTLNHLAQVNVIIKQLTFNLNSVSILQYVIGIGILIYKGSELTFSDTKVL